MGMLASTMADICKLASIGPISHNMAPTHSGWSTNLPSAMPLTSPIMPLTRKPTSAPPLINKAKPAVDAANKLTVLEATSGKCQPSSENIRPNRIAHIMGILLMRLMLSSTNCQGVACCAPSLSAKPIARGMMRKFSTNMVKANPTPAAGPKICNKIG